jgi:hypothetical protein
MTQTRQQEENNGCRKERGKKTSLGQAACNLEEKRRGRYRQRVATEHLRDVCLTPAGTIDPITTNSRLQLAAYLMILGEARQVRW